METACKRTARKYCRSVANPPLLSHAKSHPSTLAVERPAGKLRSSTLCLPPSRRLFHRLRHSRHPSPSLANPRRTYLPWSITSVCRDIIASPINVLLVWGRGGASSLIFDSSYTVHIVSTHVYLGKKLRVNTIWIDFARGERDFPLSGGKGKERYHSFGRFYRVSFIGGEPLFVRVPFTSAVSNVNFNTIQSSFSNYEDKYHPPNIYGTRFLRRRIKSHCTSLSLSEQLNFLSPSSYELLILSFASYKREKRKGKREIAFRILLS